MGRFVPSDGREWLLLLAGAALGYWVLATKRAHGSNVPGTTLGLDKNA